MSLQVALGRVAGLYPRQVNEKGLCYRWGRVAPILGGMKLDISDLHKHGIGWDDPIPNSMKNVWGANFDLIQEIGNIEFHIAVIPPDALDLDIETLEIADASEKLICAAVYARFQCLDGAHSCQLIINRNKIVHDIIIPRTELEAAVLNVSTGHIVHASLKERHKVLEDNGQSGRFTLG